MLKELETSRYSTRRTHRTYSPEFKTALVTACQDPGISIAALAGQHGMNANVLHRWLKEHQCSGRHQPVEQQAPEADGTASPTPAFVPMQLHVPVPASKQREIRIELRKGALSMVVTWPMGAAVDLASWTALVLK